VLLLAKHDRSILADVDRGCRKTCCTPISTTYYTVFASQLT
jgi:hypothetical protein